MRIDELPSLPAGATSIVVPATYNGADYKATIDPTKAQTIGYVDDANARENITVDSDNNVRIDPPSLPTGAKIIAVSAFSWDSASGPFWISPYGNVTSYLIANSGTTINKLRCRFWYVTGV